MSDRIHHIRHCLGARIELGGMTKAKYTDKLEANLKRGNFMLRALGLNYMQFLHMCTCIKLLKAISYVAGH
jgi:hypothetical protein